MWGSRLLGFRLPLLLPSSGWSGGTLPPTSPLHLWSSRKSYARSDPSETITTIEQHLQKQHPHTSVRFRRLLVVTHISTFFRLLWPCIMNLGWRERDQQDATNLMFIIKLLSQHVSGIIKPIIRRTLHIPSHTRHHRSGKLPTSSNTPT
jgi:hypothetical protein